MDDKEKFFIEKEGNHNLFMFHDETPQHRIPCIGFACKIDKEWEVGAFIKDFSHEEPIDDEVVLDTVPTKKAALGLLWAKKEKLLAYYWGEPLP